MGTPGTKTTTSHGCARINGQIRGLQRTVGHGTGACLQSRVAEDVDSADLSGMSGTPTFFIIDLRNYGAYDIDALSEAVQTAKARTTVRKPQPPAASRSTP